VDAALQRDEDLPHPERAKSGICRLYSGGHRRPYSQKGNLHLVAKETGVPAGIYPASVLKEIGEDKEGRRGSGFVLHAVNTGQKRDAYPPVAYRSAVIEHNGLRRSIMPDVEISNNYVERKRPGP